jgi:hypothetical protein
MLMIGNHFKKIKWLKQQLESQFEMLDLRQLGRYLNVDFSFLVVGISMSQTTYTKDMLKSFKLNTGKNTLGCHNFNRL